jgi:hypothetical protein
MSTQRDTRGGVTECFENGVLVLVGLNYRKIWKLGTLLQMCQKLAVRVTLFTADVSLRNDFSVVISGDLIVTADCHRMLCWYNTAILLRQRATWFKTFLHKTRFNNILSSITHLLRLIVQTLSRGTKSDHFLRGICPAYRNLPVPSSHF